MTKGGAGTENHSYRRALENLLHSYGLFATDTSTSKTTHDNKFLGFVSYRMPLTTEKKECEVSFNLDTYKIHVIDIHTKTEHKINYFGLTRPDGCEHPIEHEVILRCQAYMQCSLGFCKE